MSVPRSSHSGREGHHGSLRVPGYLTPQHHDARRAASVNAPYRSIPSPLDHRRAASVASAPKSRWPPPPTVEEEVHSLAREKSPPPAHHPAHDARSRGAIDQVPILQDVEGISHSSDEKPRSGRSSAVESGSATPSSVETQEERRFVLLSKPQTHDGLHPGKTEASLQEKRSQGHLRIDAEAAAKARSRESSPSNWAASAGAKARSSYTASPIPMSSSHAGFSPSSSFSRERSDGRQRPQDRPAPSSTSSDPTRSPALARHQAYGSGSDPVRNTNFPNHPLSAGSLDPLVASVRSMQQASHHTSDAMSDASSRSGTRGRNRKPRSRANSDVSSGSDSFEEKPVKRSSQYSYSGRTLPKESREPPARAASMNVSSVNIPQRQGAQVRSPLGNVPGQDQYSSSWSNPQRSYFPASSIAGRSPQVSPRASPLASPYNTPPPSPGRERPGWQSPPFAQSQSQSQPQSHSQSQSHSHPHSHAHSRQNSRPITPSYLSPPFTTSFDAQDSSHLHAPQSTSHRPITPPAASDQHQPQMLEVNRGSGPFASRSRPTSPLSQTAPAAQQQPDPVHTSQSSQQGSVHSSTSNLQAASTLRREGSQPRTETVPLLPERPKPALPERPPASTLDANGPSGAARSRTSPAPPVRSTDPSKATIRSRPSTPHKLPRLPPCPRPTYARGYQDWSTLPGHPHFDICPTCRKGLEDAGIEANFIPTPTTGQDVAIRCDMSIAWVRMAWLLLLQRRRTHPTVVHEVTTVLTKEEECPGRELASRKWYRLYDYESDKWVSNFDVCPRCVRLVEGLFPNLQDVFERPSSQSGSLRNCDLRMDSRRFVNYVDLLDKISQQAYEHRREPNTLKLITLAKKMASIRECREDDQLIEQPWHFIPHLPDFTVCEECYKSEVHPQIKVGSDLAAEFNRSLRLPPQTPRPVSCQLYSVRMREIWAKACDREDFELIRKAAVQRVAKERELQTRHAQIRHLPEEQRMSEGAALVAEWQRWA